MGIFDGGFSTTVPNLTDSVRLVNANGNLLASARNNLIGNVVGTKDSTLNQWEQGVRKLNTQQLTNQYNALTPEQLRAYELQGIDPRQAIADRAGFIYDDFDAGLETARAGAEGRLSDYNDTWLQNQYDLLSADDQQKAYQNGEDLITKMAKDNNIRHYDRDKADILYDATVRAGKTETQRRLGEIFDKGGLNTRRAFFNGNFQSVAPGMKLRQQDIESGQRMAKQKAINLLADPFKRELRNAHEAGEDITSESVRNNVLDKLKSEYGLENSGINSSNINIAFDPNSHEFVEQQKYTAEYNQMQNEIKTKKALETDKDLGGLLTQPFDKTNYDKVVDTYKKIIKENYPNVSDEKIAELMAKDSRMQKHIQEAMYNLEDDPEISDLLKTVEDLSITNPDKAKIHLGSVVNKILNRNRTLKGPMRSVLQQYIAEKVGLADQIRSTYQSSKSSDEFGSAIDTLNNMYSSSEMINPISDFAEELKDKGAYKARGIKETKLNSIRDTLETKIAYELGFTQSLENSTVNFIVNYLIKKGALTRSSLDADDAGDSLKTELSNYNLGADGILKRDTIVQLNKASKAAKETKRRSSEQTINKYAPKY